MRSSALVSKLENIAVVKSLVESGGSPLAGFCDKLVGRTVVIDVLMVE